jgi:hypothetical protein
LQIVQIFIGFVDIGFDNWKHIPVP